MEPLARAAVHSVRVPPGSHGLDAGCGIDLQAVLLAAAVGPSGRVTGLDISGEMLHDAQHLVARTGMCERVSFKEGVVRRLPFQDSHFEWAWSSCCVGYASFLYPIPTLAELARVVRLGGAVAILVWSSEGLLPGYPRLEAHLRETTSGIAP